MLLLIGGTGVTTIHLITVHAQTATLGEPFFAREMGKITGQTEISSNKRNSLLLRMEY
jgi:hypothetical protein